MNSEKLEHKTKWKGLAYISKTLSYLYIMLFISVALWCGISVLSDKTPASKLLTTAAVLIVSLSIAIFSKFLPSNKLIRMLFFVICTGVIAYAFYYSTFSSGR